MLHDTFKSCMTLKQIDTCINSDEAKRDVGYMEFLNELRKNALRETNVAEQRD